MTFREIVHAPKPPFGPALGRWYDDAASAVHAIGVRPNGLGETIGHFAGRVADSEEILGELSTAGRLAGYVAVRCEHSHSEARRVYRIADDGTIERECRLQPYVTGA